MTRVGSSGARLEQRETRSGPLGTALGSSAARPSGRNRGSPAERAPAGRDRGSATRARPRRGLRARGRSTLARVTRVAGHGSRLCGDRPGYRPVGSPGRRHGRCRAHRVDRGRPDDLDAIAAALRPRHQPVRPRTGIRRRDGPTARGRCGAQRDSAPGRPPSPRPRNRCSDPAAGQVQVSVDSAVDALDPRDWRIEVAEERPRTAAGTGVDAVVRAVSRM